MSRRPRILVAEDDSGVRQLLRTYLDAAGYETHTASNGLEALARFMNLRPDVMILDINMPGLDGFGVLAEMAKAPKERQAAVLVLTARHAVDDVKRAVGLGAKDYLTKPFTEAQIRARVARLLHARIKPPPALNTPAPVQEENDLLL